MLLQCSDSNTSDDEDPKWPLLDVTAYNPCRVPGALWQVSVCGCMCVMRGTESVVHCTGEAAANTAYVTSF